MTGSIAEAFYGMPEWIEAQVFEYLDPPLGRILRNFCEHYVAPKKMSR